MTTWIERKLQVWADAVQAWASRKRAAVRAESIANIREMAIDFPGGRNAFRAVLVSSAHARGDWDAIRLYEEALTEASPYRGSGPVGEP